MADLPTLSARWLADHHGVITRASAPRRTASVAATRQRLVGAGVLRCVGQGRLRDRDRSGHPRTALRGAVAPLIRGGFVTGPTAGMLAGLRRMPRASALHFSIHHGVHVTQDTGIRFRQTTVIWAIDRHVRRRRHRRRFVATARLRPRRRPPPTRSRVGRPAAAARAASDRATSSWPSIGGSDIRRGPGQACFAGRCRRSASAPNESHPGGRPRRCAPSTPRCRSSTRQRWSGPSSGRTARIDLAVPAIRWGVELDIHPEHRTFDGHARDARRRRDMHGSHGRSRWSPSSTWPTSRHSPTSSSTHYRLRAVQSECVVMG